MIEANYVHDYYFSFSSPIYDDDIHSLFLDYE